MRRLLIVEDDDLMRQGIAMLLEASGFETRQAADGVEALALLSDREWRADLILLDLMMPGMNGWQFRVAQRGNSRIADIPVLVLSGSPDLAKQVEGLEPHGFLVKPFSVSDLLATIRSTLTDA
ncbi:response regulator transcription factor [Azospirillum sp. sgz301742]